MKRRWIARAHDVAGKVIMESRFFTRRGAEKEAARYPAWSPIPGKPLYSWEVTCEARKS